MLHDIDTLNIFDAALDRWGTHAQVDICIEEMGELIVELIHFRRGRDNNVVEELADVYIAISQMYNFFVLLAGDGKASFDEVVDEKLIRLKGRILDEKREVIG
jgi:NTP pyrophosphatase (non-canonical NTP hydrolase)